MMFRRLSHLFAAFGLDLSKGLLAIRTLPSYLRKRAAFRRAMQSSSAVKDAFPMGKSYPCLGDDRRHSGTASGHYFHQDLLVARRVFQNHPARHIDVGSRVDGLVAHVAAFREIEVLDLRPQPAQVDNIVFHQVDLLGELPARWRECCDSVSCLHSLEHFGLGRYGDAIEPDGHLKGLHNLASLLTGGGTLYLSVPIGTQRIEFDAHRVFSMKYLLEMVDRDFELVSFAYVDDQGDLDTNVECDADGVRSNFDCHYGCGILELRKRSPANQAAS